MKKNTKTTTSTFSIVVVVAFTLMIVSGLAVVPLINEADAGPTRGYTRGESYEYHGYVISPISDNDRVPYGFQTIGVHNEDANRGE